MPIPLQLPTSPSMHFKIERDRVVLRSYGTYYVKKAYIPEFVYKAQLIT